MPASNHRTPRMEDVQRRQFRDFVALAIPAVWLSASPFLLIAFGADLPIAVGAAVFAATFVHAAYLARPRPMDRRVLRPIMIGSLLLAAATIAPRLISFITNDTYLNVGVSVSILVVTVLVVRSQVLKGIGSPPRPPHVGEWPIVSGGPQDARELGGSAGVAFVHTAYGAFLAELGLRLSTGALGILAAEVLVLVMLVVTLAYVRFSEGINGHARNRIAGVGRSQLLLISWGLFGYLAFLVAVGSALSPPALAESTLGFFAILFILAAAFLRSRRWNPHHREYKPFVQSGWF